MKHEDRTTIFLEVCFEGGRHGHERLCEDDDGRSFRGGAQLEHVKASRIIPSEVQVRDVKDLNDLPRIGSFELKGLPKDDRSRGSAPYVCGCEAF